MITFFIQVSTVNYRSTELDPLSGELVFLSEVESLPGWAKAAAAVIAVPANVIPGARFSGGILPGLKITRTAVPPPIVAKTMGVKARITSGVTMDVITEEMAGIKERL